VPNTYAALVVPDAHAALVVPNAHAALVVPGARGRSPREFLISPSLGEGAGGWGSPLYKEELEDLRSLRVELGQHRDAGLLTNLRSGEGHRLRGDIGISDERKGAARGVAHGVQGVEVGREPIRDGAHRGDLSRDGASGSVGFGFE